MFFRDSPAWLSWKMVLFLLELNSDSFVTDPGSASWGHVAGHSFIHSFSKRILSTHDVPGVVLGGRHVCRELQMEFLAPAPVLLQGLVTPSAHSGLDMPSREKPDLATTLV